MTHTKEEIILDFVVRRILGKYFKVIYEFTPNKLIKPHLIGINYTKTKGFYITVLFIEDTRGYGCSVNSIYCDIINIITTYGVHPIDDIVLIITTPHEEKKHVAKINSRCSYVKKTNGKCRGNLDFMNHVHKT